MTTYRPRHARRKDHPMSRILTREVRKYVYAVAIAFVPVAVYYGWIDVEASALILPLLLAILNLNPAEVEQPAAKRIPGTLPEDG